MQTTIVPDEIEKFSRIADEWWDVNGKFAPLHRINPLRIEYIKQQILHANLNVNNIKLLDIGCGGGLISEPFAKLGAKVTGIDASGKNIQVASLHAQKCELNIDYHCTTAEELASKGVQYDVVLALEIIEHVADVALFVESVMRLAKPDGVVIFSTMNRTPKAFALAVVAAEYVLRWLPRGTHDWKKFVKPSELLGHAEVHSATLSDMTGMVMHPLTFEWSLNKSDVSVNYLMSLIKKQ